MSTELMTAFTTAVGTIKTDALSMITTALPAGLAIAGVGIAVSIGLRIFRSVAK